MPALTQETVRACASARCPFHGETAARLERGDVAWLREHADVIHILAQRTWRWCQCGLRDTALARLRQVER